MGEDLAKQLKDMGFVTKDDLPKQEMKQEELLKPEDVIDHMKSCSADDCGLHKFKNDLESQAYKKGIVMGYSLGTNQND